MKKETLYIIGAGVLGLVVGYYLAKPKTEETTSSFAGSTKVPCISKDQFACLTSDVTKRKIVAILKECGLSAEQISQYLKANKKMLSSKICK